MAVVVAAAALLFVGVLNSWPIANSATFHVRDLAVWTVTCAVASAFPVRTPRGSVVSVAFAPIVAVAALGGPSAAAFVALVGTFELRELRGDVPWYGTLYNHAVTVIPAVAAGLAVLALQPGRYQNGAAGMLIAVVLSGATYFLLNEVLTSLVIAIRDHKQFRNLFVGSIKSFGLSLIGLAPMAWLMAEAYVTVGPVSILIFALPLYTTRAAYASVVEIRDMFTQTVKALASAIDARDPSTAKHSEWVSTIAVDIGKRIGCGETQLEQLEWAGLLHDVGKIGIPDAILLKAGPLDKEERLVMNRHPEKGEEILVGVKKLRPELTVIRHHHEWFNGSGYPDRLIGEEIPLLARIMHLADGYEAMTRSRPYRPIPLTHDQAVAEIVKFSGIQFDPRIVEVFLAIDFSETEWARVDRDALKAPTQQPPTVPMLADAAKRGTAARATSTVVETP